MFEPVYGEVSFGIEELKNGRLCVRVHLQVNNLLNTESWNWAS